MFCCLHLFKWDASLGLKSLENSLPVDDITFTSVNFDIDFIESLIIQTNT